MSCTYFYGDGRICGIERSDHEANVISHDYRDPNVYDTPPPVHPNATHGTVSLDQLTIYSQVDVEPIKAKRDVYYIVGAIMCWFIGAALLFFFGYAVAHFQTAGECTLVGIEYEIPEPHPYRVYSPRTYTAPVILEPAPYQVDSPRTFGTVTVPAPYEMESPR